MHSASLPFFMAAPPWPERPRPASHTGARPQAAAHRKTSMVLWSSEPSPVCRFCRRLWRALLRYSPGREDEMALWTCHEKNLQSRRLRTQEQRPHMKRLNLCKQRCRFMAAVSISIGATRICQAPSWRAKQGCSSRPIK